MIYSCFFIQQQQQIDMLKEEVKKLSVENRRLQQLATSQPSSSLSSSPSLSSSSGSPHFASSSSLSNSPNAAHRLTPPPYSFLPMLHSPSPSHAPVPLHLTLNRSQSPTRLSSTSSLSPIGSPTRHSPLLQMYQQNQQQQQFVCPQPLSSLSSLPSLPPSLSSFPSLSSLSFSHSPCLAITPFIPPLTPTTDERRAVGRRRPKKATCATRNATFGNDRSELAPKRGKFAAVRGVRADQKRIHAAPAQAGYDGGDFLSTR